MTTSPVTSTLARERSDSDPKPVVPTTTSVIPAGAGDPSSSILPALYPSIDPPAGAGSFLPAVGGAGALYPPHPEAPIGGGSAAKIEYPAIGTPSAPPMALDRLWLRDPLPIRSPLEASSYLNAPLDVVIPTTTTASSLLPRWMKPQTLLDSRFSEVKKEVLSKGYNLNPCLSLNATSSIYTLGREIMLHAINATATSKAPAPLDRLDAILTAMDISLAKLHLKHIPQEQRALIEVALRRTCIEQLYAMISNEFFTVEPTTGAASFHPQTVAKLESLQRFLTRNGVFKPVIDIKALVAAPIVDRFSAVIHGQALTPGINAVAALQTELEGFERHLNELFSPCADERKGHIIAKLRELGLQAALPLLQEGIIQKAISQVHVHGSLEALASELASLKTIEAMSNTGSISMAKAVQAYFDRLIDPAQKTPQRKLELFHHLLGSIAHRGQKALVANELRHTLHEMEMPRYKEAAETGQLPSTWISEFNLITDCLLRRGAYGETGQEPLDISLFGPEETATPDIEIMNRPLLEQLVSSLLQPIEQSFISRSKALGHELSIQLRAAELLGRIEPSVRTIVDSTDAADQVFARAFALRLLCRRFAFSLDASAQTKTAEYRESFIKTGRLPVEIYGNAQAIHSLETNHSPSSAGSRFATVGRNALQRQLIHLFGSLDQVNSMATAIAGMQASSSNTSTQAALYAAQRQTLEWAARMLQPDATGLELPPNALGHAEAFASIADDITRTQRSLDQVLAEVRMLRGTARNGALHEAWLDYMRATCRYILETDAANIRPEQALSAEETTRINALLTNDDALKEAKGFLSSILEKPGFGRVNLSLFTLHEAVEELDTGTASAARAACQHAKDVFDRLRTREALLVGEGRSAAPTLDASGAIVGYDVAPTSEVARLFARLQSLATG